MPITVTFDIWKPTPRELNRLRCAFEQLGWERLGNTAYRYPKLHAEHPTEDWFNHVLPALVLLRAFARHAAATGRGVRRFSIDAQCSTGFNPETGVGNPPLAAPEITYSVPSRSVQHEFGRRRLHEWIDSIPWPYAPEPPADPAT